MLPCPPITSILPSAELIISSTAFGILFFLVNKSPESFNRLDEARASGKFSPDATTAFFFPLSRYILLLVSKRSAPDIRVTFEILSIVFNSFSIEFDIEFSPPRTITSLAPRRLISSFIPSVFEA